jgi:alkyl hydroperoxide reductase subunit AhpC
MLFTSLSRQLVSSSRAVAGSSFKNFSCLVRQKAPFFRADAAMPDGSFKTLSLDDFKGKYLVIVFYPLDFTFACPTELTSFSDMSGEFAKANSCQIVGVSIDSKFSHLAWMNQPRNKGGLGKMAFPLIEDITKSISRDYGCLVESKGDNMNGIALRGTIIIDDKGVVRHTQVTDEQVGRGVEETLRIVQAFQFADSNPGLVCPANWKKGGKVMKGSPTGSQEYFKELA